MRRFPHLAKVPLFRSVVRSLSRTFSQSLSQTLSGASFPSLLVFCFLSASFAAAQFTGPAPIKPVDPSALTGTNVTSPGAAAHLPPFAPVRLMPGDLLDVQLIGDKDFEVKTRISSQGTIALPYIGDVHLGGLPIEEAQQLIADKLREGDYVKQAQIAIFVSETPNQVISITGEVKLPVVVIALGERRLMDIIAAGGGFTANASHLVTILRPGVAEPIQVLVDPDPSVAKNSNIPVYPGDAILVPRAGQFYVVGSVRTPNMFPLTSNSPITVTQSLAMAGGILFEAKTSATRIIRTYGTERREVPFDLAKVLKGKEPDPILQPDDIVYVPNDLVKGALKGGAVQAAVGILFSSIYLIAQ